MAQRTVSSGAGAGTMNSAACTKGVGFANVRAFVVDRYGEDGWGATLSRLSPEDRLALHTQLAVGWYPLELYARLIRAVDATHGGGDLSLLVPLGRFEADRDLGTIQRMFLRLANPAYVVEKVGEYWRRFHDSGRWEVVRQSECQVHASLCDWGCVDYALCRELIGYIGRVLELAGAQTVIVEHPRCRGRGDAECFFQGRWGVAAHPIPSPSSGELESGIVSTRKPRADLPAPALRADPRRAEAENETRDAFAASVEKLRRAGGDTRD